MSSGTIIAHETSLACRKQQLSRLILEINPNPGLHRRSATRVHDDAMVTCPPALRNALVSTFKPLTEPKKSSGKQAFFRHDHWIVGLRAYTFRPHEPPWPLIPMKAHCRREGPPHRADSASFCERVQFAEIHSQSGILSWIFSIGAYIALRQAVFVVRDRFASCCETFYSNEMGGRRKAASIFRCTVHRASARTGMSEQTSTMGRRPEIVCVQT